MANPNGVEKCRTSALAKLVRARGKDTALGGLHRPAKHGCSELQLAVRKSSKEQLNMRQGTPKLLVITSGARCAPR